MTSDPDEIDARPDGGSAYHPNAHGIPTTYELGDRLARVEEKQDYVSTQLDEISAKIDESVASNAEVAEVSDALEDHESLLEKHHFAYRVSRLLLALLAFLGSSSVIAGMLF